MNIPQSHLQTATHVADASFVASAVAAMTAGLPVLILILSVIYGLGRLYVMWLEIKLKRKALKERTDAQRKLPEGD